jgi:hypothetical protein
MLAREAASRNPALTNYCHAAPVPPLSRRHLLAAPALLLASDPAATRRTMLRPGQPGRLWLEMQGETMLARAEGSNRSIRLPTTDARIASLLPIAARQIAVVAFSGQGPGPRVTLAGLIGDDGAGLRLFGIELLVWQQDGGARLWSRLSGTGNGADLRIARNAAAPRPGAASPNRAWEEWTDYLAWRGPAPLAPALVRPPLPTTWQARLADIRAKLEPALTARPDIVPDQTIALFAGALTLPAPASPHSP